MPHPSLFLSIKPVYVRMIMDGDKIVELRRVRPKLVGGDRVIVYSTSPVKAVVGEVTVDPVYEARPSTVWRKVRKAAGISKGEFDQYFAGAETAIAIFLHSPIEWEQTIPLDQLRSHIPGFQPPQSYIYMDNPDGVAGRLSAVCCAAS